MINIYTIKLTDFNIYIYNKKTKEFIKEKISNNIIKNNKIYNTEKAIKELNKIFSKYKINTNLFKTKIIFLISKALNPAELFCFKYVFNEITNINYKIVYEEECIKEKNEIIIWGNLISLPFNQKTLEITDNKDLKKYLKNKKCLLIGNSDNLEEVKEKIFEITSHSILEYENSDTIIFERA